MCLQMKNKYFVIANMTIQKGKDYQTKEEANVVLDEKIKPLVDDPMLNVEGIIKSDEGAISTQSFKVYIESESIENAQNMLLKHIYDCDVEYSISNSEYASSKKDKKESLINSIVRDNPRPSESEYQVYVIMGMSVSENNQTKREEVFAILDEKVKQLIDNTGVDVKGKNKKFNEETEKAYLILSFSVKKEDMTDVKTMLKNHLTNCECRYIIDNSSLTKESMRESMIGTVVSA